MTTETGTHETATQFRMKPAGPYMLRDYTNADPDDLKAAYLLVDALMEQHPALIPGSMNRLIRQWRADLSRAIPAPSGEAEGKEDTQ
jgi:hypothetical protein